MSVAELKGNLHQIVDTIEDAALLERLLVYIRLIQESSQEDWSIGDKELAEMSMRLSSHSLSEVWDNEEEEHWNTYEN